MSRQPSAAGAIQTAMIIAAALIEGAAMFALVIAFLAGAQVNSNLEKAIDASKKVVQEAPKQ
jgi:F-type H+-transporting ATPase subunit c